MVNFSPNLEKQSDDELLANLNTHNPDFASLSSDELTRRSLKQLRETIIDLDSSNKRYTKAIGIFALMQIIIAGLQLLLDILNIGTSVATVLIGVSLLVFMYWFTKEFESIDGAK